MEKNKDKRKKTRKSYGNWRCTIFAKKYILQYYYNVKIW